MTQKFVRHCYVDYNGKSYIHYHGIPFNENIEYVPHPHKNYYRTIIKHNEPHKNYLSSYRI